MKLVIAALALTFSTSAFATDSQAAADLAAVMSSPVVKKYLAEEAVGSFKEIRFTGTSRAPGAPRFYAIITEGYTTKGTVDYVQPVIVGDNMDASSMRVQFPQY